jgi:hypothetical protein
MAWLTGMLSAAVAATMTGLGSLCTALETLVAWTFGP